MSKLVYYDDASKYNLTGGKWVYVDENGNTLTRELLKDYDLSNPIYYSDSTSNPRAGNEFKGDDTQNERTLAAHVENVRKGQDNLQRIKDQTLAVAGFMPIVGDALGGYQIYDDTRKGAYAEAGIGIGAMFLPSALRGIGKGVKRIVQNIPYRLKIPISSDRYYRIVGMDAIDDANKSGLIRWLPTSKNLDPGFHNPDGTKKSLLERLNAGSRSGGVPYFSKGRLYMPPLQGLAVIVGNNSIPWRRIGSKGRTNMYSTEDPIPVGSSASPYINEKFNQATTANFEYWTRGTGPITKHLYRRKLFKPSISAKDYIYHDKTVTSSDRSGEYHLLRLLNGGYLQVKLLKDIVSDFPVRIYHIPSQRALAYQTISDRVGNLVSSDEINLILDNVYYGTSVDFNNKPLGIILTDNPNFTSTVISHELDHAIHVPSEFPRGFNKNSPDYFLSNNGSELAARGSQLKDYFKIVDPNQPITEDMLRYASQNYVKDTGIDNNMTEFFDNITDWKEAAKWISKYATIVSIPMLFSKDY